MIDLHLKIVDIISQSKSFYTILHTEAEVYIQTYAKHLVLKKLLKINIFLPVMLQKNR